MGGANADFSDEGQTTGLDAWPPRSNGTVAEDWLIWNNLSAASGTLTLDITNSTSTMDQGLAAMRLIGVAVPEATTGILAVLLGGGVVLTRGKR